MRVTPGYRDLTKPFNDCNIWTYSEHAGPEASPVTRVTPDCGHTYFIRGHTPNSKFITSLCSGCERQQSLKLAQRQYDDYKWTQEKPEIRG